MENEHRFDGNQQTFPKLLQKGGYQTAVIGKWHLGTDPQGYDFWNVLPGQGTYYAPDFRTPKGLVAGTPGEYVTESVVSKIDRLAGEGPGQGQALHADGPAQGSSPLLVAPRSPARRIRRQGIS